MSPTVSLLCFGCSKLKPYDKKRAKASARKRRAQQKKAKTGGKSGSSGILGMFIALLVIINLVLLADRMQILNFEPFKLL